MIMITTTSPIHLRSFLNPISLRVPSTNNQNTDRDPTETRALQMTTLKVFQPAKARNPLANPPNLLVSRLIAADEK